MRLNQLMSKVETLTKYTQLNCLQIVTCILLHYFLNMPHISGQPLKGVVFIISGYKPLTIFQLVFKEPIKVVYHQELANQSRFNGVLEK